MGFAVCVGVAFALVGGALGVAVTVTVAGGTLADGDGDAVLVDRTGTGTPLESSQTHEARIARNAA